MADGEINRNGATIRIDDDGGVQVEPAEGQEVEYTGPDRGTDAIRDSVNADTTDTSKKHEIPVKSRGESAPSTRAIAVDEKSRLLVGREE